MSLTNTMKQSIKMRITFKSMGFRVFETFSQINDDGIASKKRDGY
jgi:hypothetical protein